RQLGWPLPHPGWSLLIYLPMVWLVLDRLGRRAMPHIEVFLVLVGLWVAAHAVAIGYARGGVTTGFVSRYTDFLALGILANAGCLLLLGRTLTGLRARAGVWFLAAVWIGFSARGLWTESVSGHAGYNLERRLVFNQNNLSAIRGYLATGESKYLAQDNVRVSLYPHPPDLEALLAKPRLRALLPPETGAVEARADHGRLGSLLRPILRFGPGLLAVSAALLGVLVLLRPAMTSPGPVLLPGSDWTSRHALLLTACAAGLAWAALLAWERPFDFRPRARWPGLLASAGIGVARPLVFTSTVGRTIGANELQGAVATEPREFRPFLHGTLLDRENYTGIACSPPFVMEHRFATVLLTGWPNRPGNAVRWQVEDPATGKKSWVAALGQPSGPGNGFRLWTELMEPYRGWRARLFLFDGTTGERGWVGITEPVMTDDPDLGSRWLTLLQDERAESTHPVLAGLAVLLTLSCLAAGCRHWRSERTATAA
ncbi:MAG: hypothetical protein HYV75_03585, partial [Opitutae bacterium]|nr:hypothetical protein [Opitutae bacterium]